MNWVLICNKSNKKLYENKIVGNENNLATITNVTDGIYNQILNEYNPHGVIVADFKIDVALKFRELHKNLKIIYLIKIDLDNSGNIQDLLKNDISPMGDLDLENILTADEVNEKISELRKKEMQKIAIETLENENEKSKKGKAKKYNVKIDVNSGKEKFDGKRIKIINEQEIEIPKNKVFIGVRGLQRHVGCTHVSIEIAEFLNQQGKNAGVVISDDETYNALVAYYGFAKTDSLKALLINRIKIFPYRELDVAIKEVTVLVCDYGILQEQHRYDFEETSYKFMIVGAANWDVHVITDYLNNSEDVYKTSMSYLFYPLVQSEFVHYNKQLGRIGCRAFRLGTSLSCNNPCKQNKDVYSHIMGIGRKKK